ncbi:hypothetical protein DB313_06030 (plasmid) [Borrelia turcica IST7]|uniref:Uncharacterized protein n=1 Tax=Borrelia turcica IST7 TaxID=1104446 RepID=A0A386PQE7_9SPIR|nr:hypothetical protein [Borrelia turcica]AYE37059.1 hypothetical protein DB313_06030 [Borrelia turcica IST7]
MAYQTLLKRVYESGYNIDSLYFKETRVKSFSLNEQGKPVEIDDIEYTAYIKTVEVKTYSFSIMLSEYIGTFYNRKRGVIEVSKMCRKLSL